MIDPSRDAFGAALLDYLDGKEVPELVLEVQGGGAGPAMHPEWFFRDFDRWEWLDRELLPLIEHGPVSTSAPEQAGQACTCKTGGCA